MPPRLLVLASTFPRWKNDADPPFVYELSKRLTDSFEVIVHTPHYPGAKRQETMDKIQVHRFRYFFKQFEKLAGSTGILPTLKQNKFYYAVVPFFLIAQLCSLLLLVKRTRPDIIHAHWLFPQGFFAVIAKMIFDIPVVVTGHGTDIFGLKGWFFEKIKFFTVLKSDKVTVVSRAAGEYLQKTIYMDVLPATVPMGVDSRKFNPDKKQNSGVRKLYGINDIFLLFIGRLSEVKGVRYLIEAMPYVLNEYPEAKLLIVGDGESRQSLEEQVKELDLQNSVFFAGAIPNKNLPDYYAAADIFIGPSIKTAYGDNEGFGLTFVEASMSGCLVIGTDTGGIRDIIKDGETGFLVPQKDPAALAEKIVFVIKNRDNRTKVAKHGRDRCRKKYDWSVIASHYRKILQLLVNQESE